MAMDPVSRRLAAAAMGLAFGLSRDEELEKTRLDLERARMEREDFRNGAGPDTEMLQQSQVGCGKKQFARMYATALLPSDTTVNKRRSEQDYVIDETREDLERCEEEKEMLEHDVDVAKGMLVLAQRSKGKCRKTEKMLEEYFGVHCMEDGRIQDSLVGTAFCEMNRRRQMSQFHETHTRRFAASLLQPSASSSQQPS